MVLTLTTYRQANKTITLYSIDHRVQYLHYLHSSTYTTFGKTKSTYE